MLLACGYETVPRDWHVKDTTPPLYCRAYYVISGDVTYYAENMCTKLRHGYLYVFPSAIPHEMVQNPDNPLTCLYLHLDISLTY